MFSFLSVFNATRPFGHLSCTDFIHFLKKDMNRFPHVYTSNFGISAQGVLHIPKTAKMGTVEGGVLVRGVQPKRHNFRRWESFRGPTWSNLYRKI